MAKLTYRPVRADESSLAADVMTASFPREPEDPVEIAHRWAHPKDDWTHGRYFAELDGKPIAFLEWQHGPWSRLPERHCWVEVWLDKAHMDEQLLTELWEWTENAAAEAGARTLNAAAGEDEDEMLRVIVARGYNRQRTDRVWELDLTTRGAQVTAEAAAARSRMEADGIRLLTLADWDDPQRMEKLHELNELTRPDVPHTGPHLPQTFDDFMARTRAPGRPHDRWWLALDGTRPVAMSYLSFPTIRGSVWTAYTCTHPEYRRRGIARAVKLQSLAQAVELGAPAVRTANDTKNEAMLRINEALGYQPLPGFVSFMRRLPARALR